jgi:phosphoglycerate-specific signal transduction histidine kinase
MKLSEIQEMWTKDAKINELDLGKSSIQIAELHAKYLNILSNTKLQLRKCEADYLRLRRTKFKYYRGEMTREELEELGWNQFQGLKPLKNEVEDIVNCDEDVIRCVDKVEYMKAMLYQLEQIIRSLNGRGWEIKNAIEWTKFTNGLM